MKCKSGILAACLIFALHPLRAQIIQATQQSELLQLNDWTACFSADEMYGYAGFHDSGHFRSHFSEVTQYAFNRKNFHVEGSFWRKGKIIPFKMEFVVDSIETLMFRDMIDSALFGNALKWALSTETSLNQPTDLPKKDGSLIVGTADSLAIQLTSRLLNYMKTMERQDAFFAVRLSGHWVGRDTDSFGLKGEWSLTGMLDTSQTIKPIFQEDFWLFPITVISGVKESKISSEPKEPFYVSTIKPFLFNGIEYLPDLRPENMGRNKTGIIIFSRENNNSSQEFFAPKKHWWK